MSKKPDHAKLLTEINERFRYASDEWRDIQAEGAIDMRYIAGDAWEPEERRTREDACRPCLSLDELNQYVNQLINEIRQHKRAIQVTPIGTGADDDSARLRADLIRQIEYRSNAQQAYTTMFENTVQRSYGFLRVQPQYVNEKAGFDQELLIVPIVNPDLVLIDPDILKPDGSDMRYAFVFEWRTKTEFQRQFPNAEIQDFSAPELKIDAPLFIKDDAVLIAEYWTKRVARTRELLLIQTTDGPLEVFADELTTRPSAQHILKSRKVEEFQVTQYLTNGVEILETTDHPGQDIPIVACFGKVLYLDEGSGSKRRIMSLIRLAREAQKLYAYYRTAEAEQVGMSTKFPYFVRRGSLKPDQLLAIQKSLHEPVAAIQVEATVDGMPLGMMPEMPVRNPFEPAIQALEVGAEGARRGIQAAVGQSPLPSSAQRRNEKSGVALKQIDESAQKGSYHFIDHYEGSITRTGAILNNLLPFYYDTPRDVAVRQPDETASMLRINDPTQPDKDTGKVPQITDDQYDVTLSTGPDHASEREVANDFTDALVTNIQMIAAVAGPKAAGQVLALAVKLKNLGEIGDQIADVIAPPEPEGGQQIPPELQQQIQQMQAQMQELQQLADKNRTDLQKTQMTQEAENTRAAAEIASKETIELQKLALARQELEVKLEIEMAKLGQAQSIARAEQEQDLLHRHADRAQARETTASTQAHDRDLTDREHAHAGEMADRQAEQAQADRDMQAMSQASESGA